MPFELWHDLKYLRVDGPVVQVGNSTLVQRRHPTVSRLNIPVVTRIVGVWPCDTDQTDKVYDVVFLTMLVE